jgi:hypothetical protein
MSIASEQIAILQAMGVDVYTAYEATAPQAPIQQKDWFNSLLNFLGLDLSCCEFSDAHPINFDPINKTLTLPLTVNKDDATLKREIWRHIQDNAIQQ